VLQTHRTRSSTVWKTMKVILMNLLFVLSTWQVLAIVTPPQDETNGATWQPSRRRQLRQLDDFGSFLTETPSMALIDPKATPSKDYDSHSHGDTLPPTLASRADDNQSNTARGEASKPPSFEGSDEEDIPTERGEADDDRFSGGDNMPTVAPGEATSIVQHKDDSPVESPTVDTDESPAADIDESPAAEGRDDDERENPSLSPTSGRTGGEDDDERESPSLSPSFGRPKPANATTDSPTPSPTSHRTKIPSAGMPSYDDTPTPHTARPSYETPTYRKPTTDYPFTSPSFVPPTPKPYTSNGDEGDPLMGPSSGTTGESGGSSNGSGSYTWENSSVDEMEHDQTVIIALSVVFGVMFLFSVIVAHQMLENPHGCCAR
jgi:hypothetical protein